MSVGDFFSQAGKLFSADIWKMTKCHFWANVMLRQPHLRASRASPAQKSQGLRVVCSKNFSRATFFVFWVTQLEDKYVNNLPVKQIWRKSAVWYCAARNLYVKRRFKTYKFAIHSSLKLLQLSHHFKWRALETVQFGTLRNLRIFSHKIKFTALRVIIL